MIQAQFISCFINLKLQKIKIFYLQYASSHRLIGYFIALQLFRLEINWFERKFFFTFDSENIPLHQEPRTILSVS